MTRRSEDAISNVAVVIIGRNEGERLRRCIDSVNGAGSVVYVDSGSSDGSVEMARARGVDVVDLDMRLPFTAARARNAGFARALALAPEAEFVQFVDGDCEVEANWVAAASSYLRDNPAVAVVFGRRREQYPEQSVYNRLCDLEWQVPVGEAKSCGGDAMMRVEALRRAGGYRDDLIAGEEPELCVRVRQAGWRVVCLDRPMTVHDARLLHFSQFWRRCVRCGYAFAQGAYLHGGAPEHLWVKESRRAWIWGLGIPAGILLATLIAGYPALLLLLIYPAQIVRLYLKRRGSMPEPFMASLLHVVGRFPEVVGQLKFALDRYLGRAGTLIEYK